MSKTNFDRYLEEQMQDPAFAERFERAGQAWDVALQIAALREKAGLSQRDLARKLKTSQQNISRLDLPGRMGWLARYLKEVDANETTVRFWQEIYDDQGKLVEIHEKYPVDKGHQKA